MNKRVKYVRGAKEKKNTDAKLTPALSLKFQSF